MNRITLPRYHALDIFRYGLEQLDAGQRIVLIVLTDISGSSARPLGTAMVVSASGDYAGYLSNGCVDADIALHAMAALDDGVARTVRYGAGSPYMDIRLPCGGGMSARIIPDPSRDVLVRAVEDLSNRHPIDLDFTPELRLVMDSDEAAQRYTPPLKIIAAGRGEDLSFFVKAACTMGLDVFAISPDATENDALVNYGATVTALSDCAAVLSMADQWTAVVTLFHDHDLELPLLVKALDTDAFYIGAMGSRKTHAARLRALHDQGQSPEACASIRGPIGLVPSMRDAARLAISVLAEIIDSER